MLDPFLLSFATRNLKAKILLFMAIQKLVIPSYTEQLMHSYMLMVKYGCRENTTVLKFILQTGTFVEEQKDNAPVFGLVVNRVDHWNPIWTQVTLSISALNIPWPYQAR